jgi:hypothetical protein
MYAPFQLTTEDPTKLPGQFDLSASVDRCITGTRVRQLHCCPRSANEKNHISRGAPENAGPWNVQETEGFPAKNYAHVKYKYGM